MQRLISADRDIHFLPQVMGLRWISPGMHVTVKVALNMESCDLALKPRPDIAWLCVPASSELQFHLYNVCNNIV